MEFGNKYAFCIAINEGFDIERSQKSLREKKKWGLRRKRASGGSKRNQIKCGKLNNIEIKSRCVRQWSKCFFLLFSVLR